MHHPPQCLHASSSVSPERPQRLFNCSTRNISAVASRKQRRDKTNETVQVGQIILPCISPNESISSPSNPNASPSSSSSSSSSSSCPGHALFAAGPGATEVGPSVGAAHSAASPSGSEERPGAPPADGLHQQPIVHMPSQLMQRHLERGRSVVGGLLACSRGDQVSCDSMYFSNWILHR